MSLSFAQPDSGLMPSDDSRELMSLPEVLEGTSFISASGRAYRLFGNEEKAFSMPTIPEVPPILAASKSSALSLEEALKQIEMFSSPAMSASLSASVPASAPASVSEALEQQPKPKPTIRTVEHICAAGDPPTLQLFQALGVRDQAQGNQAQGQPAIPDQNAGTEISDAEISDIGIPDTEFSDIGISLKLVKSDNNENSENASPNAVSSSVAFSVKNVAREVSHVFPGAAPNPPPKPKEESQRSLRIVPDHEEEPFIVPFAKPEPPPEKPPLDKSLPEKPELKNTALRIVTEFIPPILCSKVLKSSKMLKKCGQHRRKVKILHRKRFSLPPVSEPQMLEPVETLEMVEPVEIVESVEIVEPVETLEAVELPVVSVPKPPVDLSTFQWSGQLDSLMQTASNQIRMLTDHLIVQQNQGTKVICFKSVFPGDGCSTILLCATRALIERNYRVLLIDTHHRHIDLPKQLNLSGNLETGNEVLAVDDRLGLWVWQESKTMAENTALIAEIVTAHHEEYDFILLDDGSVTECPLTTFVEFWNRVELNGVVLVTNTKCPTEMPVSHIARRLRQYHIPLIGIAENYV